MLNNQDFSNPEVSQLTLPCFEQVEFQPLDENAAKEALISVFLFLLPISIAVVAMVYFLAKLPISLVAIVAGALLVFNCYVAWLTKRGVAMTGVALREHDLILKRGVFWQRIIAIPFNRIQHIETHRGPIERKFKLSTLKLFTAGGAGADLEIHGLNIERASKLRQFILTRTAVDSHEPE